MLLPHGATSYWRQLDNYGAPSLLQQEDREAESLTDRETEREIERDIYIDR